VFESPRGRQYFSSARSRSSGRQLLSLKGVDSRHRVEVVQYDPEWPERYAHERDALCTTLEPWLAAPIEHIGSTAVPGLSAKPVIDLMVPVHGLPESLPAVSLLEQRHGYSYWPYKADVMHWLCKPSEFVRTHHVHFVPVHSDMFRERLLFRDALRANRELRERYAALKMMLADTHPHDREAYTDGKAPFIAAVLHALAGHDRSG
jgi:GrpB-like predicted nucleotidyltransferase (UPF0157 family)